jgi:prepilin-type processing-associated H-X9-DG protein
MNDNPSQVHGGACGFGFADGHAELHKWKGPGFRSAQSSGGTTYTKPSTDFNDAQWLTEHTTYVTP